MQSLHKCDFSSNYFRNDTICAVSTGVGGAISILRLSGPDAFWAVEEISKKKLDEFRPRTVYQAIFFDPKRERKRIDQGLILKFEGPNSFTGEDLVELHLHGSAYISSQVLECLMSLGIRQALPGEFSFRAVRNGKMNLTQAQALADLIQASNENALDLALEKMSGTQSALVKEIAESMRSLCMFSEVGIDFSDQDIEEVSLPVLKKRLSPIIEVLSRLEKSFTRGTLFQNGIRTVLVGRPNSGKSSYFNAVLGEDRSIVSPYSGTTRDIIRERVTLRNSSYSYTFAFEDTAGIRALSNDEENRVESIGIRRTLQAIKEADLVVFVVDGSEPQLDQTLEQISSEILESKGDQWVGKLLFGVITKADLIQERDRETTLEKIYSFFDSYQVKNRVLTSAKSGEGIALSIDQLLFHCSQRVYRSEKEVLLTRLDHYHATQAAQVHLKRAKNAESEDLFAADVRQGLHALNPLIGETVPDDILGKIFSEFCIGK